MARWWTAQEGSAEGETESDSWLWTTAVAKVGETPSVTFSSKRGLEQSRWAALFPLWPLPHRQHGSTARRVALSWWLSKAPAPYNLTGALRQRNMSQMKEQSKTSERQLSAEDIANRSDEEFKALVIKMLTDLIELGRKMKNQRRIPKVK